MGRMLCWFSPLAVLLAVAVANAGDAEDKELKALGAEWAAFYKEPTPPGLVDANFPSQPSTIYFFIKADGTAMLLGPRKGTERLQVKVTVNPAKTRKTMDIEIVSGPNKGKKQYGVYEIKPGKERKLDVLVLVVADFGAKEKDRPKELKAGKPKTTRYEFGRTYSATIE
jgi:hypothetical protein